MDKLKSFVDKYKADFEKDSLPEGHFERFERKLAGFREACPQQTEGAFEAKGVSEKDEPALRPLRRPRAVRLYGLAVSFVAAAVVALFFLLRIPGGTTIPPSLPASSPTVRTCKAQQEIEELRIYYTMQINEMMAQIERLYKQDKTPGSAELLAATKKVLTDNYMFEETVLPTLPCSNAAVFAMTQHYTNSLESLSIMLKQMERVTNDE